MFVRLLIGRDAGQIQNQPYHAATGNLAAGTVALVTDEELAEANLLVPATGDQGVEEVLPEGYSARPSDGGGFDLFKEDGVQVNEIPFPNLAAARSFAHLQASEGKGTAGQDPDVETMTVAQLKEFAAEQHIDLGENTRKDDIKAAIQLELEARAGAAQTTDQP